MRVAGGEFGEFPIDEYSIMIEDKEGNEHALHVDRPEYIREILKWIEIMMKCVRKRHCFSPLFDLPDRFQRFFNHMSAKALGQHGGICLVAARDK